MKINIVPSIIAAAISALLAYGLFSFCHTEDGKILLTIGGFISLFLTLAVGIGVRFPEGRTSTNTAVLGFVFFFLLLASNIIFTFVNFSSPTYIIINGLLTLIFIGVTYAVAKAKQ